MASMMLGLDYQTMVYLGYSAAALAAMGMSYWMTKDGITSLQLSSDDIQLVARGAMKGALHTENLDNILSCINDPAKVITDIESAVAKFNENDMNGTSAGLMDLGMAFAALVKGVKDCDSGTTEREIQIMREMMKSF